MSEKPDSGTALSTDALSAAGVARFNLIFLGELRPDTDPRRARLMLTAFFGLRDPSAVEVFFRGGPVPLRRNLIASEAEKLYQQLHKVGLLCELEEVAGTAADAPPKSAEPKTADTLGRTKDTEEVAPLQRQSHDESQPAPELPAKEKSIRFKRGKPPNLFALRPGPSVLDLPAKRESAQLKAIVAAGLALVLALLIAVLNWRFPLAEPGAEPRGPIAVTTLAGNELVVMAPQALLIHERSGIAQRRIGIDELELNAIYPPLFAIGDDSLLLNANSDAGSGLHSCDLASLSCTPFPSFGPLQNVTAVASSYLGDTYYLLSSDGALLRTDAHGEINAQSNAQLPTGRQRLLARDGLLHIAAAEGPLLGIYRPDAARFGEQLDALFVLAPDPLDDVTHLEDVAFIENHRFALLATGTNDVSLVRFDSKWGGAVTTAFSRPSQQLSLEPWRDKLLISDPQQFAIARFAADGSPEAAFESTLLIEEHRLWRDARQRHLIAKYAVTGVPVALIIAALIYAFLQYSAYRALSGFRGESSAILDPMPAGIAWLREHPRREQDLRRVKILLLLLPIAATVFAAVPGYLYLALSLVPALLGAGLAWRYLSSGSGGFLGLVGERVIVVDHEGHYFYGEQRLLENGAGTVLAPTTALPLSFAGARNFDIDVPLQHALLDRHKPLLEAFGTLWFRRHPWLLAILWITGGWLVSVAAALLFT